MVREYFFTAAAFTIPIAIVLWFLYSVGKALFGIFQDWQLGKELDELQAQSADLSRQRAEASLARLSNGCDHDFETAAHSFPDGVCHKCGIAKERPSGACDHQWQEIPGPVPVSACAKCGKRHSATQQRESLA